MRITVLFAIRIQTLLFHASMRITVLLAYYNTNSLHASMRITWLLAYYNTSSLHASWVQIKSNQELIKPRQDKLLSGNEERVNYVGIQVQTIAKWNCRVAMAWGRCLGTCLGRVQTLLGGKLWGAAPRHTDILANWLVREHQHIKEGPMRHHTSPYVTSEYGIIIQWYVKDVSMG